MESRLPEKTAKPPLGTIVNEVLGDLAFLVGEEDAGCSPAAEGWLQCDIEYRGPVAGTLRCWSTASVAQQLAANLLGTEPQAGEAQAAAQDAVREFVNVLCGQLVTAWYGREAVFTLSIPCVHSGPGAAPPEDLGPQSCRVYISGEPLYCQHRNESA